MCDKIHQSHSNGKRSNKGRIKVGVSFFSILLEINWGGN